MSWIHLRLAPDVYQFRNDPFELDQMMELDMKVHHHEAVIPVGALSSTADALLGIGIVAAVLGIVITMGALGGPPEEIGHKVAAALAGRFWESYSVMAFWVRLPRI